uniref:Uncharacterized protein n=1 Tax=Alexandrium monilatum TaxID=311494 RepID=A0A7S4S9X4_9DINO|mmetsp:Transcript_62485/g.186170  ORF Transcript_62485/g.186170 Transcript_62485/m.186170 type:complete len:487 (-) Transcript_62485:400-1860(-)
MAHSSPWRLAAIVALAVLASADPADVLTPAQRRLVAEVRAEAAEASHKAEAQLLGIMGSAGFGLRLRLLGSQELAKLSPQELLERLRANLDVMEWTNNFGLDAVSRRLNPGNEAMDLDQIELFGHVPTEWELKVNHSRLVENMSHLEWGVLDAAETGLYRLPAFGKPGSPTAEEMVTRPKYLAGNLRRLDTSLEMYGAYAAVIRNDVVRDRAVLLGTDSGGWVSTCNTSVKPVRAPNWLERLAAPCTPVSLAPLGVTESQMHTVLANTQTFHEIGGSLPALLHQFLTPVAKVRPIEARFYMEGALLGPIRPVDIKLLVGSFPGLFGTPEGLKLRAFCKRHGVPLAWGFSAGRVWADEGRNDLLLLPFEPFEKWTAGAARLMDPAAGWSATNVTSPTKADSAWEDVWAEAAAARQKKSTGAYGPKKAAFERWWAALVEVSAPVLPLRAADCASADLCFGTYAHPGGRKECVCRASGGDSAKVADIII